jgi:hypothetical protein
MRTGVYRNAKRLLIQTALVILGLAPLAFGQSGGGPKICPLFDDYLTPTFLDFIYPGISTHP